MRICPGCGVTITYASAWSSPEPLCESGIICPACGEFIADEDIIDDGDDQAAPVVAGDDPADGELPALDHGQDGDELLADIAEYYQEQATPAPAGVELVTREVDGVLVVEPVERDDEEGIEE